ncbi:hypothetical protein GCM10010156_61660 [Planobispora rosea]|uniref:HTH cro/C1-type domain-containing protein n=1 Tax=Planobispora rosea TaxID=35762 RepID=A0A8J3WG64_PLARO|nr:helix-turn-helix transcriptional regulator [Planobispora rosea]GGS95041.1 hypothetical protein GCM10010156_61660 [Planobispora rosea]GIH87467.1 hypothetical protein Pro02_58750 [Planobispora rosea]
MSTRGRQDGRDDPEEEHRSLGRLIRAWRDRALLTQEQLADRAGVNVRTIRRLEGDAVGRPRNASIRLLAEALGLDTRERAQLTAAALRPCVFELCAQNEKELKVREMAGHCPGCHGGERIPFQQ